MDQEVKTVPLVMRDVGTENGLDSCHSLGVEMVAVESVVRRIIL